MATVELTTTDCWCGLPFAMPARLYKQCRDTGTTFYCPLGHKIVFKTTEADKLRRERNLLKQQLAEKDDAIREKRQECNVAWRTATAYKGHVTRIKNRIGKGVCPCCNRSFQNLARHMNSKHPDYSTAAEEVA